jgi:putative endonuclease
MIRTKLGHIYTGITQDVQRRFKEHQEGGVKAAKSLKGKRPLKLIYQEEIGSHSLALKTEAAVKKWPKEKKESLVKKEISLGI